MYWCWGGEESARKTGLAATAKWNSAMCSDKRKPDQQQCTMIMYKIPTTQVHGMIQINID